MLGLACSGGGGGSADAVGGGGPEAPPPAPVAEGSVVATLETSVPPLDEFLLRGTVPVPAGTFPRPDGLLPFTVRDYDGTLVETQTELVSRYANEADGADVVEVIARVHSDPTRANGAYTSYEVTLSPRLPVADPGTPGVEDLATTQGLPSSVRNLLTKPRAIEVVAFDCFGNEYMARPLDGTGEMRLMRHGRLHTELAVHQQMLPTAPKTGPQETLPHLFGVHAYVSTFAGEELVGLDLRIHNGHSGVDSTTELDDVLDRVYFERIELRVAAGLDVEVGFEDPFFGTSTLSGGKRRIPLVAPNGDGTMHVMRWQGQTERRVILAPPSRTLEARQYVQQAAGIGTCQPGTNEGLEHWSWWNAATARYWPQNFALPSLDHMDRWDLRGRQADELARVQRYLIDGGSDGKYPVTAGTLGWAHPYGVPYGGMTSGSEIFMYDGVTTAAVASRKGVQAFRGLQRMNTDRMWTAFYDADGTPSSVESWLHEGRYIPFEHFGHPKITATNDPVGLRNAPQFQIQHVEQAGLQPDYEDELMSYDAHDYQHYIRYTRAAKVLAWLTNDSLAKDALLMQAENFRLAYHRYENSQWGGAQGTGMRADQDFVAEYPGAGFNFGRGEAWGADCAVAAYALGSLDWRRRTEDWFRDLALVISDGQARCSGFIQANVTPKNLNGLYRTRQQIEQSITENMLMGLRETVFLGKDAGLAALTRDTLVGSLRGFVSDMVWGPFGTAPPFYSAVGPLDVSQPPYCSFNQMPMGSWSTIRETYQDWCSFAWGYELTGDPVFLEKARIQAGVANLDGLLRNLENAGLDNLENKAALVALMQRLYGR